MAIDGLDHDEDHGPTFEAFFPMEGRMFWGRENPAKPFWSCFVLFLCFGGRFSFVWEFFGIRSPLFGIR